MNKTLEVLVGSLVEVLLCSSYNQEESANMMMIMKMMKMTPMIMKTTMMMKMIVV